MAPGLCALLLPSPATLGNSEPGDTPQRSPRQRVIRTIAFLPQGGVTPLFPGSRAIRARIGLRFPPFAGSRPVSFGPFLEELSGKSRYLPGLSNRRFCTEKNRRVQSCSSRGSGPGPEFWTWRGKRGWTSRNGVFSTSSLTGTGSYRLSGSGLSPEQSFPDRGG